MKRTKWLSGLAVAALLAATPLQAVAPLGVTAAQAQEARLSFTLFFDDLEPHGLWVRHERYRYVWCPEVDVRWRPYTNGRWIYIRDRGWYFDSDEPFAWAVYHYGRWVDDDELGWCWVPGNRWAPSWVVWRRGGGHVAWAPLPPEEDGFQIDIDIDIDFNIYLDDDDWVIVREVDVVRPIFQINFFFGDDDPDILATTQVVTNSIVVEGDAVSNVGPATLEELQAEGAEMQVFALQDATDPKTASVEGETVVVDTDPIEPTGEEAPQQAVEPDQAATQLPLAQAEAGGEGGTETGAEAGTEGADAQAGTAVQGETGAGAEGTEAGATAEGQTTTQGEATTEGESTSSGGETATDGETAPATGEEAPVTECPEGQQLLEGACVPIQEAEQPSTEADTPAADAEATTTEGDQPAADQPADAAPAAEPAPADETTPAEGAEPADEAAPADEVAPEGQAPAEEVPPLECPEGFQIVDGQCVPIEAPAEGEAPAQ